MASSSGGGSNKPTTAHKDALSEFAEYVEKQQEKRRQQVASGSTAVAGSSSAQTHADDDELDFIDDLGLNDDEDSGTNLKDQLLGTAEGLEKVLLSRMNDGRGETLFELGVENSGEAMMFTKEEYETALTNLKAAAAKVGAECADLTPTPANTAEMNDEAGDSTKKRGCYGSIMVRKVPKSVEDLLEIRVAVVGNVDAGKSTMLGVLVKGTLDDGRGKARVNLFRHKHEMESGRTSSVGMEIMGFDAKSQTVSSQTGRKLTWEEIGSRSAKVISFTDLAGHEKYLRTTVFGLLGTSPDYCLLMVAANNGLIGMSKEHLGIAVALNVPVMVVITKIDMTPPNILQQTINQLTKILKSAGSRKIPIFIKSEEEVVSTATHFVSNRICPIFQISNVTGEGLDFVRTFLNCLPYRGKFDSNAPFEFHVNDTFSVPFVGTVVSGVVKSGNVHAGDHIMIGPDSLGNFITTSIRSIERKRIPVQACQAGQSASFALKRVRRRDVRKGMVVIPKTETPPKAYREFTAEVLILSHATTIRQKYQAMLHMGPISQTCSIIDLDRDTVRTGDRAIVAFRFIQRPEYILPGSRLIFREGRTKGLGIVKDVGYDAKKGLNPNRTTQNGNKAEKATEKQDSKPEKTDKLDTANGTNTRERRKYEKQEKMEYRKADSSAEKGTHFSKHHRVGSKG